jgi:4-alpha-glucanotransferase
VGDSGDSDCVPEALRALGIENLVLNIHDPSFPSSPSEDIGRGSPYSRGGLDFLRYARGLGFGGIQFGPQGETDAGNPSPYDGTAFSRGTLSIALGPLVEGSPWAGLLRADTLASLVDARPPGTSERVPHRSVAAAQQRALAEAFATHRARSAAVPAQRGDLADRFARFRRASARWLVPDSIFEVLRAEHGDSDWRRWRGTGSAALDARLFWPAGGEDKAAERRLADLRRVHHRRLLAYAFAQFLAHEQHAALRRESTQLGLGLFGDLQIGFSSRDAWRHQGLFLPTLRMGAPPSRTTPEGQAWGYPVLDPRQYHAGARGSAPGPVLRLLRARMTKLFAEFDGLRIDHPHGLVCPWVYDARDPDPLHAVRRGARLFSSPDLADHPELAPYAISTRARLNPDPNTPRYADDWVVTLTPREIRRYAILFDAIVRAAQAQGRARSDLICEVLSTLPFPLKCVLDRHQLGRFRVTQKADLHDPRDVYRSENAAPDDWVMVGNHDTPPIWSVVGGWGRSAALAARARHLAERLAPDASERGAFAERFAADPGLLTQALFADLFASPARNVLIFFSDLFGLEQIYNTPGSVSDENWALRLGPDYRERYLERLRRDRALNLPFALALAIRSRGRHPASSHRELLSRLDAQAARLRGRV